MICLCDVLPAEKGLSNFVHASRVFDWERESEEESGTDILEVVPSRVKPLFRFPAPNVAFETLPSLLLLELSSAIFPSDSSRWYRAIVFSSLA